MAQTSPMTECLSDLLDSLALCLQYTASDRVLDLGETSDGEVHEMRAREFIEEYGFDYLGEGLGRVCYRIPDEFVSSNAREETYVVKFARPFLPDDGPRNGVEQNETEAHIWSLVDDEEYAEWRASFTPVECIADDSGWLVMPYRDSVDEADDAGRLVDHIRDTLNQSPFALEVNDQNTGLTEGKMIQMVDYGMVSWDESGS